MHEDDATEESFLANNVAIRYNQKALPLNGLCL